jgi:hypothetical protein
VPCEGYLYRDSAAPVHPVHSSELVEKKDSPVKNHQGETRTEEKVLSLAEYKKRLVQRDKNIFKRMKILAHKKPDYVKKYFERSLENETRLIETKENTLKKALESGIGNDEAQYVLEQIRIHKARRARIESQIGNLKS